jgi:hypothetical protein
MTQYIRRHRGGLRRRMIAVAAVSALAAAAVTVLLVPAGGVARSQAAPNNVAEPTISGTPVVGANLTGSAGTWENASSYAYQWVRCAASGSAADGSDCAVIGGATTLAYSPSSSDVGFRLRFRVTATNTDGSTTAASNATDIVADGSLPTNTKEPVISGTPVQGQTLTTSNGDWTGNPTDYDYQWVRCGTDGGNADGSNCTVIGGATTNKYTLTGDDVGRRLRSRVIAKNSAGQTTAASNATPIIAASSSGAGAPVNRTEPRISGTAQAGRTLTATSGSWTGTTPIAYSYQWVRCPTDGGRGDGSNCATIGGATRSTYVLTSADVGLRMRVKVTARNSVGSRTAASNPTAIVQPSAASGIITLPSGERSIPVTSVPADQRLVVDRVTFTPNPVRSRTAPITVRVRVKDTRGFVVRDAQVFLRSTPLVTTTVGNRGRTATDGWIAYTVQPQRDFPALNPSYNVQFFVKAYRAGDPPLAGVAAYRLVQVALGRP